MKLNWFSPLPPARTGIADYTAQVLPALGRRFQVTLWTDQHEWDSGLEAWAVVRHFDPAQVPWSTLNQAEVTVFNLGNHGLYHGGIFEVSRRLPGIVILHDLALYDFVGHTFVVRWNEKEGFLAYVERRHGPAARADVEACWTGQRDPTYMAERYPLTEFALEGALGVLVHTRANLHTLVRPTLRPVAYAPLPYAASLRGRERAVAPPVGRPYRLILFGHIGPNRRLEGLLQALATFPARERFHLDVYGAFGAVQDELRVRAQIESLGLEQLVTLHGFVPDSDLHSALESADLAINLRYPSVGEASLSQLLIWDHALPTLVTPVGVYAGFPSETVCFVRPDHECADIHIHLTAFLADPERFRRLGESGRRLLEEQHAPEAYVEVVDSLARQSPRHRLVGAASRLVTRAGAELGAWLSPYAPDEIYQRVTREALLLAGVGQARPATAAQSALLSPLPAEACRATVRWLSPRSVQPPDHPLNIRVRVKNLSGITWPALGDSDGMYRLQVGNHWLDAAGRPLCPEDGRSVLPHDLQPQEEVELTLFIWTPKQPGVYVLELDLLQNGVTWFKDQGSATDTVRVRVCDLALGGRSPNEGPLTVCTEAGGAEPLPRRWCTAQITWMRPTYRLEAGARVPILVHVKNPSDVSWPARHHDGTPYQIFLGNHWLDPRGYTLVVDDGRAALPGHLGPLEEVAIPLVIQAPATPGQYRLELDLVQDGVAWFKALGSEPDIVDVLVCPGMVAGAAQEADEDRVLAGLAAH